MTTHVHLLYIKLQTKWREYWYTCVWQQARNGWRRWWDPEVIEADAWHTVHEAQWLMSEFESHGKFWRTKSAQSICKPSELLLTARDRLLLGSVRRLHVFTLQRTVVCPSSLPVLSPSEIVEINIMLLEAKWAFKKMKIKMIRLFLNS